VAGVPWRGDPDSAQGFERFAERKDLPEGPCRLTGVRCFRNLEHVTVAGGKAYLSDLGNAALRILDLASGRLTTLAGGPQAGQDPDHPLRVWARNIDWEAPPTHVPADVSGEAVVPIKGAVAMLLCQGTEAQSLGGRPFDLRTGQFIVQSGPPAQELSLLSRFTRPGRVCRDDGKGALPAFPRGGAALHWPGQMAFDGQGRALIAVGSCIVELSLAADQLPRTRPFDPGDSKGEVQDAGRGDSKMAAVPAPAPEAILEATLAEFAAREAQLDAALADLDPGSL
jgi:hypothetical protein